MRFRRASVVTMASLLSSLAFAQNATPAIDAAIGQVVCHDKSLTICQGDFCSVTFEPGEEPPLSFDFVRDTYVNPPLGPTTMPMEGIAVERVKGTFIAKFRIAQKGAPAAVQFVANTPADGPFKMTAARRLAYPETGSRPPIVVITGMECLKSVQ